jgi:DNA replication and repair protein RecF
VWDEKVVASVEELARRRADLVADIGGVVSAAYADVAGAAEPVSLRYEAPWRDRGLRAAQASARADELRRGLTLVGPHRDDLVVTLNELPSRTHASQGEQRSLALALRLAAHRMVHDVVGTPPVLLLDDVFSELDPERSSALLASLPPGQTLLSTAAGLPAGVVADQVVTVTPGEVQPG